MGERKREPEQLARPHGMDQGRAPQGIGNDIRHVHRTALVTDPLLSRIRSQLAPKVGHKSRVQLKKVVQRSADLRLSGGAEGICTPDPLDANEIPQEAVRVCAWLGMQSSCGIHV